MKSKKKLVSITSPAPPVDTAAITTLASNVDKLRSIGIDTISEAEVFCAAATQEGATIGGIVKKIGMPFSTCSRVAFSMLERGLLRYEAHATDRRKKIVRANLERLA